MEAITIYRTRRPAGLTVSLGPCEGHRGTYPPLTYCIVEKMVAVKPTQNAQRRSLPLLSLPR